MPERKKQRGTPKGRSSPWLAEAFERGTPPSSSQPDGSPATSPPDQPAPVEQPIGNILRWTRGPVVTIGRCVMQPYISPLQDLVDQCKAQAAEAGFRPKNLPSVFAVRYTTQYSSLQAEGILAAVESSTYSTPMQEFCENEVTIAGVAGARQFGHMVAVNCMISRTGTAYQSLLAERALVRQVSNNRVSNAALRVGLFEGAGDPEQGERFLASASRLAAELGEIPLGLDRLDLVPNQ